VSCELIPNPEQPGKHRGYGFVEFEEEKSATDAIKHMSGFDLCGRQLKVGSAHSVSGGRPTTAAGGSIPTPTPLLGFLPPSASTSTAALTAAGAAAALAAVRGNLGMDGVEKNLASEEDIKLSSVNQRFDLMNKLARTQQESAGIVLKNMVTMKEVDGDLEGEVREECSKFGPVQRVVIHITPPPVRNVHIYVLFQQQSDAVKARQALDRRYFAGKVVSAEFYPLHKIHTNEFH